MDDARFDVLTQRLGLATTRRFAVRGVLGGFAGLLALLDPLDSRAKKKKCKKSQRNCGKRCIPKTACCGGCGNEACCNGACVDLAIDAANCGACGRACPDAEESCINGVCTCGGVLDCPAPCTCAGRAEVEESACIRVITAQSCSTDAECGLGKACLVNNKCATACLS